VAQDITPDLVAKLLDKFPVGAKKHRAEIEVDYVIPGFTEIGESQDLLRAFGSVTGGHAGASSTQTPTTPENVNDGNGATYSEAPAGGEGGALEAQRWWIGDLGAAMEITAFIVKWNTDFGPDLQDALANPTGIGSIYARFQESDDGLAWTDLAGSFTDDDGLTPNTFTWTFDAPLTKRYARLFIGGKQVNNLWPGYKIYTWGVLGTAESEVSDTHGTATFQVSSISIDRSRGLGASQLDVTLDNEDNTRGWYQLELPVFTPNNPIRLFEWLGPRSNRVCTYTGLLDRDHDHRNPKTVELKARSRLKWLLEQGFIPIAPQGADEDGAVRTEDNGVYRDKTIEYIVGDILDRAGWPAADRAITATGITLHEYVLSEGSWLDQIVGTDRLAAAAGFDCGDDELGIFRFQPSPLTATEEPEPVWEFAAGVNVMALDHEVDDEARATRVLVTGPMTSAVPKWSEVWRTSALRYPAGIWYDPSDAAGIKVIDRVTKYLYRIRQSDRAVTRLKYLGGHPLGLSGIPGDGAHYLVMHAPWRSGGGTSGNYIEKRATAGHGVVATYPIPDGEWSGMKSDGSHIFLTNYGDGKVYKLTMTGDVVGSDHTIYQGVAQTRPTGLWINGSTMAVFFAGPSTAKRFLLMDTSDIGTVTGTQSTKGTWLAGGEADTDTDIDLYGDADAGSFGLTSGLVAKFTLAELITKDVSALEVDYDLEDALGRQSEIGNRIHDGCPNSGAPHQFEMRLSKYSMKVVQSLDQAQDMAARVLSLLKRLRRVLDLATTGHPGIQLNDPISYTDGVSGITLIWIIDSYKRQVAATYTQTMSVLPWEAP
jgi:hypothetical protein